MKKIMFIFYFLLFLFSLYSTIINIPADYPAIQQGIDAAAENDTVLVAEGTYYENLKIEGKEIMLTSWLIIDDDPTHRENTIIDGSNYTNPDEASVIIFLPGSNPNAVPRVVGLTIKNGNGSKIEETIGATTIEKNVGGGFFIEHLNPVFTNNNFHENDAEDAGGAGYVLGGKPNFGGVIEVEGNWDWERTVNPGGNSFLNNYAAVGKTFYVEDITDTLSVQNCHFDVYSTTDTDISTFWATSDVEISFLNGTGENEAIITDVYVSPTGNNSNNGLSSVTPFQHISYALSQVYGDSLNPVTIHLAAGTYSPSNTGEQFPLQVPDYVTLSGITTRNETILDAEEVNGVISITNSENILLTSMKIINGRSDLGGGGIYSKYVTDLYITDCIISNNTTVGYANGGGIFLLYCTDPNISNVSISQNEALAGGGISCYNSNLILSDVIVNFNDADFAPGGLEFVESPAILSNVSVTENYNGGIICDLESDININSSKINSNLQGEIAGGQRIFGGIYCYNNNVIITSSEISNNGACGLYLAQSSIDMTEVTVAGNSGSGIKIENENGHPSVNCVLSDVTVSENNSDNGGGIYCSGPIDFDLSDLTITGNESSDYGGGIYFLNSDSDLGSSSNILIKENTSGFSGGGIALRFSNIEISDFTINSNVSNDDGGGIYAYDNSNITISHSAVNGNSAYNGGAIFCSDMCNPSLSEVVIKGNVADNAGGGLYCHGSDPNLSKVTISGNSASDGGSIFLSNQSNTYINNCILWNNAPNEIELDWGSYYDVTILYSDIQNGETGIFINDGGSINWLSGNIDQDPLFVETIDPSLAPTTNGDLHLTQLSPCINAGNPASPLDSDGTVTDLGAYFYNHIAPPTIPTAPTPEDFDDFVSVQTDLNWTNGYYTETIDLYFDSVNPPTTILMDDVSPVETFEPGTLSHNTSYYWKIVCRNANGETIGDIWNFTTESTPLDAEFSSPDTTTTTGTEIQFTDLSAGNPTSWEWNFNNDSAIDSYAQNPTWIYNQPGMYTVTLTVSNERSTDTETKVDYIDVRVNIPDTNFKAKINENLGQSVDYNPTEEDLNGIAGSFYANGSNIASIEGAQYLISITDLFLQENLISDISILSGLVNLTRLYLHYNQISDISAVESLTDLTSLLLYANNISNISYLSSLTNLTLLGLGGNNISSVTHLSGLTNLTYLTLNSNIIDDISSLSNLTNMISLNLYNNNISDISGLSGLVNVSALFLNYNQINDISAISNLTNLEELHLYDNQISDISALVENSGLGLGDILYLVNSGVTNPLSKEAIQIHIPILLSRNFATLQYPSNSNNEVACYPNPARNETDVIVNADLEWQGNFPSRTLIYDVWFGETSDNLSNIGIGTAINDTLYSFTPSLSPNTEYWWKIRAITDTDSIWSGLWHFTTGENFQIADFTVSDTVTVTSSEINFSDLSTGNPISWEWDFENDGNIDSYLQNPSWIYNDPGIYSVSLTVSFGSKKNDTELKTDYVDVRVNISDANFKAEINNKLGQLPDYNPSVEDLNGLTGFLNATNSNISSIEGAQYLTNLEYLGLANNQISVISPIANLTNLIHLFLNDNQITNISALSSIMNLSSLYLQENQISDIHPLVENSGLGAGDDLRLYHAAQTNPLSQEAINVHVPILESRGFSNFTYPIEPNNNVPCYPSPPRDQANISIDNNLFWRGNFPSREIEYYVWIGEVSDSLQNVGSGIALNDTIYCFSPSLNLNSEYWWKIQTITSREIFWSGLWHFTTGDLLSPQNVIININGTQVEITWDTVPGAISYKIYSSDDPYSGFAEDTTGTFNGENWSAPVEVTKKFYYIKAFAGD